MQAGDLDKNTAKVSVGGRVVLGVLSFYQNAVSPWFAPRCRYYPSCSSYAVIAVKEWGVLRGGWLAIKRVFRCNPWNYGGVDDVPQRRETCTTKCRDGEG